MIKFHPSSLGLIMTEPKVKKDILSQTCKTHLIEIYLNKHYGRKKLQLDNKWVNKGNAVEGESIRIYNEIHGTNYVKNTETLGNDYLVGTPDIHDKIIDKMILEAKSSFDLFTFSSAKHSKLDASHEWQCHGYMDLSGLKKAKLFYALSNTPYDIIQDEKRKLAWKMGCIDDESDDYKEQCAQIERNCIFDIERFKFDNSYYDFHSDINFWCYDIPVKERLHVIDIPYDQKKIDRIHKRIDLCNQWMQTNLYNIPSREEIEQL